MEKEIKLKIKRRIRGGRFKYIINCWLGELIFSNKKEAEEFLETKPKTKKTTLKQPNYGNGKNK